MSLNEAVLEDLIVDRVAAAVQGLQRVHMSVLPNDAINMVDRDGIPRLNLRDVARLAARAALDHEYDEQDPA